MADQPVTIAEELAAALIVQMLRLEMIDAADVKAMGEGLSEEARHLLNTLIVEAEAPSDSDWRAGERRKRFRVVEDREGED